MSKIKEDSRYWFLIITKYENEKSKTMINILNWRMWKKALSSFIVFGKIYNATVRVNCHRIGNFHYAYPQSRMC